MQLRWIASPDASALYAADCVRRGRALVDAALAEEMAEPAAALQQCFNAVGSSDRLWRNLVGQAADFAPAQQLAEMTFRKSFRLEKIPDATLLEVASRISQAKAAFRRAAASKIDSLADRIGPLRSQWEARGPGLMKRIAWLTDERVIVESGAATLVYPCCGGGGFGYFFGNVAVFEGLLADPVPELPEVLRLGWILAQLNLSLPMFCEEIHPDRFLQVAELAMLPAVLEAAEHVELASCDHATLALAAERWLTLPPPEGFWETLFAWWETCREEKVPFGVALRGLDQMLAAGDGP